MKLKEIQKILDVSVERDCEFLNLGLIEYKTPKLLTFISDIKYLELLRENKSVCAVFCSEQVAERIEDEFGIVVSKDPRLDFFKLHNWLAKNTDFYCQQTASNIDPTAQIHPSAVISDNNVKIGKGVLIEPNVVIMPNTILEDNVILRAGVVVGTQGFEFKISDKKIIPVEHSGGVLLHQDVELQALTHVAKSVFGGYTEVGESTKTDALVHIAHNSRIGKRCRLAAQALIAGSAVLGDDVWVGPGAIISSSIMVGDRANITIGSVVTQDVPADSRVSGNFAIRHNRFIEFIKSIR